jgi:hypothetical protein
LEALYLPKLVEVYILDSRPEVVWFPGLSAHRQCIMCQ